MRAKFSICVLVLSSSALAQTLFESRTFERKQLSTKFFSEGATFGDINGDGRVDVVAGPYWYEGPDFERAHEIYAPKPFETSRYSDNFFAFVHDLDGDGWNDVLFIGFPGRDASWFENPRGESARWQRHKVFAEVDNESPTFTDLTGDGRPELVCQFQDRLGYASVDWSEPQKPWTWHPISVAGIGGRFTHGLGVGDVDGDGRRDVLWKHGWWQQPDSLEGDPVWGNRPFKFAGRGGAQMHVIDVDGDGDNDVVTAENAHGYGLYWFEHRRVGAKITFERHTIMGLRPSENRYGVAVGNLHAMTVADVNRDGLPDLVTGNRYWAHGGGDKADHDAASIHWFELRRDGGRVEFVPHEIDGNSGVGTQVVAGDADRDGDVDVVVGNKMGVFVHRQRVRMITAEQRRIEERKALTDAIARMRRPANLRRGVRPKLEGGREFNAGFETGDTRHWNAEGAAFQQMPIRGDTVVKRRSDMRSRHVGNYWIGGYEPARSDEPMGTLTSVPFKVAAPWASYLIGGGRWPETRVEIVRADSGEVVHRASGRNDEALAPVAVDLTAHQGQAVFIRIVDERKGHWAHVNFDDFLFHATEPTFGRHSELANQKDGFSATEAAARMQLPDGFRVDVFAAEPDVHQPVGFAIDERGRLWVAEAHSYPKRREDSEAKDAILVFEDVDNDGKFDRRTVFKDDLNLISGIEVGFGGVWVGAAPWLMFIPDRDGDLVPDSEPQILLDGWHWEDTHETLNSFMWGPDGWLYGCHGVFTHSVVGKPGTSDKDRQRINAGVWRYHPTKHEFEVFAWGTSNPWGVDFDQYGQAFVTACVIPHAFHIIQGGRYRRQAGRHFNPHVYDDIKTIADHLHYVTDTPHAGNSVSDSVGGGHAHCGAMIYRGGRFPAAFDGALLMNNVHGHRVISDVLRRRGSGYVASHGPELLRSNDRWFMGINLKYGPDGNVYLIDWYDKQNCHRNSPEIWDRTNGRIYKVSFGDAAPAPRVNLAQATSDELVDFLFHANNWYGRRARRVLQERGADQRVAERLVNTLGTDRDVTRRLRSLWALHVTSGIDEELFDSLLSDDSEYVRAWTVQLLFEDRDSGARQVQRIAKLARTESSELVRLYIASALQRMSALDALLVARDGLLAHAEDGRDHNLPLMLWYGLEHAVVAEPDLAMRIADECAVPRVSEFIVRRLASAGGEALEVVLAWLGRAATTKARRAMLLGSVRSALENRRDVTMPASWPAVFERVSLEATPEVLELAVSVGAIFGDETVRPRLEKVVADATADAARRRWAFESLVRANDASLVPLLHGLVGDPALGGDAVRALAAFDDAATPRVLIDGYESFAPDVKRACVATLAARDSFAQRLLDAVEAGRIPRAALDAPVRQQLQQFQNTALTERLERVWGKSTAIGEDAQVTIERYKRKLPRAVLAKADLSAGRALFAKTCMACHKLFGSGGELGPDITGSNRRDLDYLLSNIIEPSAELARDYMLATVYLKNGSVLAGMIRDESESSLTVTNVGVHQVVASKDVDRIQRIETSLMPPGQLEGLSDVEVRDLIAYLGADAQVPLEANPENSSLLFSGVDLDFWNADPAVWSVENGEMVGRTQVGLSRNNFAVSELLLRDFKFGVDVKLLDDRGNSGIQFRSVPIADGEMRGYQADIGPGWWGKLYEESARGLLSPKSGESFVQRGDWNRYEIEAVGERVRTWINGNLCVDRVDPRGAREGVIGLQVHSGGPTEVRFRRFTLEVR